MAYLDPAHQALPFQAGPDGPQANTSRAGAVVIAPHAPGLCARYRALLARHPFDGQTDEEAAAALNLSRSTVIPRRHELGAEVECIGRRMGPHGVSQKVYRLRAVRTEGAA